MESKLRIIVPIIVIAGLVFLGVKVQEITKNQVTLMDKIEKISVQAKTAGNNKKNNKPQADPNKVYDVAVGESFVLGKKNAPVTVIKWTDFQCPYCARSVDIVDKLHEKYPNDVKIVIKNFPLAFHKQAKQAAIYSLAADKQGKYWEMYTKIFEKFRELKTNQDLPVQIAVELGLNKAKFIKDAKDPKIAAQVEKEIQELQKSGIPRLAVPKFLINGKEPQGQRSLEAYSAIIDAELKKKKG